MKIFFLSKKMLFAILTIFIFVFSIQMVEPSTAAKTKLVYKKSYAPYDKQYNIKITYSFKIYTKGKNNALIIYCIKNNYSGSISYAYFKYDIKKVSKNKIKINIYEKNHPKANYIFINTIKKKWKKSALQYAKYYLHA